LMGMVDYTAFVIPSRARNLCNLDTRFLAR
jgi:hypothetical protein